MKPEPDYYAILHIESDATAEQIRDHYRRLAKVLHPDRNGGDPWCHEQTQRINVAFEVLSNPTSRAQYDARRAVRLLPAAPRAQHGDRPTRRAPMPGRFSMPVYEDIAPDRPRWMTVASWSATVVSATLLFALVAVHARSSNTESLRLGGLRRMMLIPPLHTGLMDTLTGDGPAQIERNYKDQFTALNNSAQSELDDAQDTLTELRYEDHLTSSASGEPARARAARRHDIESSLMSQMAGLQGRVRIASRDIDRFDWNPPRVRMRLRYSSIDQDLEQIDESIDPLQTTVCGAQDSIFDHDPFADPAPTQQAALHSAP